MSFGAFLNNLLIYPLQLFFETLYGIAYRLIGNYGIAIIILSLAVNIIVFPLYRRADAMQKEERDIQEKMAGWVKHIKNTFRGDERYMMLNAYYRENNYSSFMVLRGSISLLLQIPFFTAAYRFLHNYQAIKGVSFGPIADLGAPDGLLQIAGLSINLLPILMTMINIISGAIYTRGMPVKSKVQLYGMALIFLVLLYRSPAGLVFYWTLNNLFSLVKNIFYKLKNPRKVLGIIASVAGIAGLLVVFIRYPHHVESVKRKVFVVLVAAALQVPMIGRAMNKRDGSKTTEDMSVGLRTDEAPDVPFDKNQEEAENKELRRGFLFGGITLAMLTGCLIPSALIADSPLEFVSPLSMKNPNLYVLNSLIIAAGLFVVWFGVFYWLFDKKAKRRLAFGVWVAGIVCAVNYMAFGKGLGNISADIIFDDLPVFSRKEILLNLVVILVITAVALLVWKRKRRITAVITLALLVGVTGLSIRNLAVTHSAYGAYKKSAETSGDALRIPLSKTENNVVVIMLDRAIGAYYPYIMSESPELEETFSGFTWYPNTLSYGMTTNFASACLFGGYEYTPEEINKRSDETLRDKQNEALKVMPAIFDEAGYEVTVSDPPYAGYSWIPDLSIYNEYPNIHTYNSAGYFADTIPAARENTEYRRKRDLFCYGFMKASPVIFQSTLYDGCNFFGKHSAVVGKFCDAYSVLTNLESITETKETEKGTFIMLANDTTHEPCYLQKPRYEPQTVLDNEEYEKRVADRMVVDGKRLKLDTDYRETHYNVNVAAMKRLGEWFDYLKEEGVYDNTRIILVADHGRGVAPTGDEVIELDSGKKLDTTLFRPLLLVKDFDAEKRSTEEALMTNADVPSIALAGIIDDPVNPFTGKEITDEYKRDAQNRHLVKSGNWDLQDGDEKILDSSGGQWYEVGDDINNAASWKEIDAP